MLRTAIAVALALAALAGCADKILSDDTLRNQTAQALNQPTAAVQISDRRYDGSQTTYYTAHTPRGAYRCTIDGGTINTFGMTNPPVCSRP